MQTNTKKLTWKGTQILMQSLGDNITTHLIIMNHVLHHYLGFLPWILILHKPHGPTNIQPRNPTKEHPFACCSLVLILQTQPKSIASGPQIVTTTKLGTCKPCYNKRCHSHGGSTLFYGPCSVKYNKQRRETKSTEKKTIFGIRTEAKDPKT